MRELTEEEKVAKLESDVVREQQAKAVLTNPEFMRAFTAYRAKLFDSFSSSNHDETERREEIYRQMKSLDTVEATLRKSLQDGRMAREQLSLMQKVANKAKNIVGLR